MKASMAGEAIKNIIALFLFQGFVVGGFFLVLRIPREIVLSPAISIYQFLSSPIEVFFISLIFSWIFLLYSIKILPFFVFSLTLGGLYYLRAMIAFAPHMRLVILIAAGIEIFLGAISFYYLYIM